VAAAHEAARRAATEADALAAELGRLSLMALARRVLMHERWPAYADAHPDDSLLAQQAYWLADDLAQTRGPALHARLVQILVTKL
jgi:hypothetical protein